MSAASHTILVVDDEQGVVDGIRRTLRHEPYEVVTTTSPHEALDRLREGGVDILISDIDMPEMTGLELVTEARRNHPDVVRMLLTGDASLESALEAINEGAVHKYLTKPWSSRELRETLRQTIDSLEELRREAMSTQLAARHAEQRGELEQRHPGIAAVSRVDGAYLLNDVRVVELLAAMSEGSSVWAASQWLPLSDDATLDMRRQ